MEAIKEQSLQRALKLLNAIGCKFAVIDPDGEKHGELEVAEPANKKFINLFGKGELRTLIQTHAGKLDVGDVAVIPTDEDRAERVRCGIHNFFAERYGAGSYTTHRVSGGIEVMRLS